MKMMKKILQGILPAALCLLLVSPAAGRTSAARTATEPDSVIVEDPEMTMYADTVAYEDSMYEEDDAPAGDEAVCPPDDELLSDFSSKDADYNYQNKANANTGVSFTASIFLPGEVKKQSGFNLMVARILGATLPEAAQADWKTAGLDKMLENKWKAVKEAYLADVKDFAAEPDDSESPDAAPYYPNYSYRTNVMPVWRFDVAGGAVTYKVDDETYLGGAHGMPYCYYLTLSEKTDSLLGLTDIFKEESLPAVFRLVGEKLAARHTDDFVGNAYTDAELAEAPNAADPLRRARALEEYGGKWYPRPALTQCGVLFSYAPYEKDSYAAGTVEVLLPFAEIGEYLKVKPQP